MGTKTGDSVCVLDEADKGGLTLEEIAEMFGLTRERIRQVEALALAKLKRRGTLHVLL
jgi:DNA-directed RNA polymerase sigma subunit (sigma70/sigma32)